DLINIPANHPVTLNALAKRLKQAKQSDAAVRILSEARSIYPGDFWLNFDLAAALALQKDYDGAVRFYTAAIAIRPKASYALNNLGLVLKYHAKLDEAAAALRRAIEIEEAATTHSSLGIVLNAQGKRNEALASFRKAI